MHNLNEMKGYYTNVDLKVVIIDVHCFDHVYGSFIILLVLRCVKS
jgi:hypothetical protein